MKTENPSTAVREEEHAWLIPKVRKVTTQCSRLGGHEQGLCGEKGTTQSRKAKQTARRCHVKAVFSTQLEEPEGVTNSVES